MTFTIIFFMSLFLYVYAEDGEVAQNRKLWFLNETEQVFQLPLGSSAQLNCAVNDMESSNVTWLKNGSLTLENTFNKVADVLNNEDYGNYTCSVCSAGECIQKCFTIISPNHDIDTIPKLPYFINPKLPRLFVKVGGNMATFHCKAGGYPKPTVKWFKNNTIPTRFFGKIKYTNSSLQMQDLTISDAGAYTCVVCNYLGCVNHMVTLNVVERCPTKPRISSGYPKNVTTSAKSTAILECLWDSELEPYIAWYKCKMETGFEDCEMANVNASIPEILILDNVTSAEEGWYTCFAANSLGHTLGSAYLKVIDEEPPRFLKKMRQVYVKPEYGSVTFKCKAAGHPTPTLKWLKNYTILPAIRKIKYTEWYMQIKFLNMSDAGEYTCIACNDLACVNHTYILSVTKRPPTNVHIVSDYQRNVTALVYSTVALECRQLSHSWSNIQWVKGKKDEVNSSVSTNKTIQTDHNKLGPKIELTTTLQFINVTYEEEGWYSCIVTDRMGYTIRSVYLKIDGHK